MRVSQGETAFPEGPPAKIGMADGPSMEQNESEIREVASKVVEDVIHRATIEANGRQGGEDLPLFPVLPAIQIDVVASRTPSPESLTDDTTGNTCMENTKAKNGNKVQEPTAVDETPKQLREFARTYLQDIFSKAVQVAEERSQQKMGTMKIAEESYSKKSPVSPWYTRVGESLVRFIRVACLCGGRRNNS